MKINFDQIKVDQARLSRQLLLSVLPQMGLGLLCYFFLMPYATVLFGMIALLLTGSGLFCALIGLTLRVFPRAPT